MNVPARKTVEWFRDLRVQRVERGLPPKIRIEGFLFRGMYRCFKKHLEGVLGHPEITNKERST